MSDSAALEAPDWPASESLARAQVLIPKATCASSPFAQYKPKAIFFVALALATALPLFGLGFGLGFLHPSSPQSPILLAGLFPIIAATGYGHVASTTYLYLDSGFWQLIRENWKRFVAFPFLITAFSFAAFRMGSATAGAVYLFYFVWQMHHYQRQNYGVIAFAAQDKKRGPLPRLLQIVLDLGTAGGVCTMLARPDLLGFPIFRLVGIILFLASTGMLIVLLVSNKRIVSDPLVLFFTLLGWAFFLPTLLSQDLLVSFTSYAMAHGAQYLLFMAVIAGGSRFRWAGPAVLVVVTYITWSLFNRVLAMPAGLAILNGLIMTHFMVDAKVWRMRDVLQRNLIRKRFKFLFL